MSAYQGGGERCERIGATSSERAKELVDLEVDKGPGVSTVILPPSEETYLGPGCVQQNSLAAPVFS